jgi:uncharacterized membrane protein
MEEGLVDDQSSPRLQVAASVIALVGLADSIYLTASHYTKEPVPCSLIEGCDKVLTSEFAEFAGLPIAAFGAAAYFIAFSLAVLAAYSYPRTWQLFGLLSSLMAAASLWLVYVQIFVIGAICQFCMLSALSSIGLFAIYGISKMLKKTRGPESEDRNISKSTT